MTMATVDQPATFEEKPPVPAVPNEAERAFALAQREAHALATSSIVPPAYQGNVGNCLIALNLAKRTGVDALMVMQNLHIIFNRPSFGSPFLIACVNSCGRFTPLRYRFEGEGMEQSCVAYATEHATGDLVEGPPVTIQMAHDEGWVKRKDSKWPNMPDLMMRYRAAAFFARTLAPELILGMHTTDELEDSTRTSRREQPSAQAATAALEVSLESKPVQEQAEEVDPETGEVIPPGVGGFELEEN